MKLKSKLIATIVSMCAAIAVMGVGVWASTSQSFQVTVKNDIDVKILSVDADIYGEFAVYSQFIGHTYTEAPDGETRRYTNTIAQYYQQTDTGVAGFSDRFQKDHGYLLYASDFGGYNDGATGTTDFYPDGTGKWYETNVKAAQGSGYYKYITEAKEHVYFATARSKGIDGNGDGNIDENDKFVYGDTLDESQFGRPNGWAKDRYNIDYTTHVAQITYMYTIRQWKKATASAASNSIDIALSDATNENLNQKLTNNAGNAGVYIDAYITRATKAGDAANMVVNGAGATTAGDYSWYPISLEVPTNLPDSTENETYYIVLTYTFARNSANLDLEGLADAVEHRIVMASKGELNTATEFGDPEAEGEDMTIYDKPSQLYSAPGSPVQLNYATGLSTARGTYNLDGIVSEHQYNVVGQEFNPNFSPARALSTMTADQRATTFAAYTSATDTLTHSNILGIANNTEKTAVNAARPGYIFAAAIDGFDPILTEDTDADSNYGTSAGHSNGSTAWYVKTLVDGGVVPAYTHTTHELTPESNS